MIARLLFCGVVTCLLSAQTVQAVEHYARFTLQGEVLYGLVSGNDLLILEDGLFPLSTTSNATIKREDVRWLPPTQAQKVFAVGMNFASHRASRANAPPPLFLKLPSSLIGHKRPIQLPEAADNVHFEGELVLVIGKQAKEVSESEAAKYIFGVTIGNDLTERTWQRRDLQWLRAKAADGFGPVGPVIATDLDYNNLVLTTRLNGKIVQQENTRNMIHSPAKVVSYLSQYFTLEPGDLIFMGTPGRTRSLHNEDTITVEIEGIGVLSNTIVQ